MNEQDFLAMWKVYYKRSDPACTIETTADTFEVRMTDGSVFTMPLPVRRRPPRIEVHVRQTPRPKKATGKSPLTFEACFHDLQSLVRKAGYVGEWSRTRTHAYFSVDGKKVMHWRHDKYCKYVKFYGTNTAATEMRRTMTAAIRTYNNGILRFPADTKAPKDTMRDVGGEKPTTVLF